MPRVITFRDTHCDKCDCAIGARGFRYENNPDRDTSRSSAYFSRDRRILPPVTRAGNRWPKIILSRSSRFDLYRKKYVLWNTEKRKKERKKRRRRKKKETVEQQSESWKMLITREKWRNERTQAIGNRVRDTLTFVLDAEPTKENLFIFFFFFFSSSNSGG